MGRDMWIMTFFGLLSTGMLIWAGVKRRNDLRLLYTIAISADFYTVLANVIGIGLHDWSYPVRIFPQIFDSSVVYDLLFFPASIVLYLVYVPRTRKILFTFIWVTVLSMLEHLIETYTELINYSSDWSIYKTWFMYLLTYFIFYWLYRWLAKKEPGDRDLNAR